MKLKVIQLLFILCAVIGVIGLGVEIFANDIENLTVLYIFGVLTFTGLLGNAVCAILRVRDGKGGVL